MGWVTAAFHERHNIHHMESLKLLLFVLKAISAAAYLFVLGYLAGGGAVDAAVWIVLLIGAVFDLVPELLTVNILGELPAHARRAEQVQLGLAVAAYLILVSTLFVDVPARTFIGYATFAVVWIGSFLIQQGALFTIDTSIDL